MQVQVQDCLKRLTENVASGAQQAARDPLLDVPRRGDVEDRDSEGPTEAGVTV